MKNQTYYSWLANHSTGFCPAIPATRTSSDHDEPGVAAFSSPNPGGIRLWSVLLAGLLWSANSLGAVVEPPLTPGAGPTMQRRSLAAQGPSPVAGWQPAKRMPATERLRLEISVPVRDHAGLAAFVQRLYAAPGPDQRRYLTPAQFTETFGPTYEDYQAVIEFARSNHLQVVATHRSRMVLELEGLVSDIESAFQIQMQVLQHPGESREIHAPNVAPSVNTDLPILDVNGLNGFASVRAQPSRARPAKRLTPAFGSGPGGNLLGQNFRDVYVPGVNLTGVGQMIGLVEFDGYLASDIAAYEKLAGLPQVPLLNVPINGFARQGGGSAEVALDIEMCVAMAPGLAGIVVFEAADSTSTLALLDRLSESNQISQFSCSWGLGSSPGIDAALLKLAAQGQTFFYAAGDTDAYVKPQTVWMQSPYGTSVGGTTLQTDASGSNYVSETVWNGGSTGSSGGVSDIYALPFWQQGINMTANGGSTNLLNRPDVSMVADGIWAIFENGHSGSLQGTSCAAPLWAGFMALVNQQSLANGGPPLGFLNPTLYAIARSTNYATCFHDVTNGNNCSPASPGNYFAVPGYDLCSGLGSPAGSNLINALCAVAAAPILTTQPTNSVVNRGRHASLQAVARGAPTLNYQWRFNGTNLPGQTGSQMSLNQAQPTDAGAYQMLAFNAQGSVTSVTATLTVVEPPIVLTQPASQAARAGESVVLGVSVAGTGPLSYQWQLNGDNLPNNLMFRVAGTGTPGFSGDGSSALSASFNSPVAVAIDQWGNLFISDAANGRIRRIGPDGLIHTFAGGGVPGQAGEGRAATNANLSAPAGLALDARGNLYFADQSHGRVCRVDTNGMLTIAAGNGGQGYSGDGGPGTNATLYLPAGLALDALGNLFIADKLNNRIRLLDTRGIITTVAGNGTFNYSGDGGFATNASLKQPTAVALDATGNLYVSDTFNCCIRKVDGRGLISTVAGKGTFGYSGDGGAATNAGLTTPRGIAVDQAGNIYVADYNVQRIRKVDTQGIITTVAGTGAIGYSGDGGAGSSAFLNQPLGVALDAHGNLYLADTGNNRIRKMLLYAGYPTLAINGVGGTNTGNYSVVITSPHGRVVSQTARLSVTSGTTSPPLTLGSPFLRPTPNGFAFHLDGSIGQTVIIDASTNLLDWSPITTNVMDVLPFPVSDPAWTNYPQRFYRVRQP